jgi:hypothetical protein
MKAKPKTKKIRINKRGRLDNSADCSEMSGFMLNPSIVPNFIIQNESK